MALFGLFGKKKETPKAPEPAQKETKLWTEEQKREADRLFSEADKAREAGDNDRALELYMQAARLGSAAAMFNCGVLYYNGEGMAAGTAKALYWYEKAAGQGDIKAQYICGIMYEEGKGTPKDRAKAVHWFKKAASQGMEAAKGILKEMS